MATHWSNSSAWRGYDRWRVGIDDPHLNPPDPCEDCECEERDEAQEECDCGCHKDWTDFFVEP